MFMKNAKRVAEKSKEGEVLLKLIGKPCCEPCNQAHFVIKRLKTKFSFTAKRLDISEYPEYNHYNDHIPVVLINEKEISRSFILLN